MTEAVVEESKKRKQDLEELEIDLTSSAPLSKKQKRLLRKGKITLDDLTSAQREEALKEAAKAAQKESDKQLAGDDSTEKKPAEVEKFGVWIGNLSFDTTKEDLINFMTMKTQDLPETNEEGEDKPLQVNEKDIIRIKLPTDGKNKKKIKGFAYVDLKTKNHQTAIINLSETTFNGRNVLIKDSTSYEGRPEQSGLVENGKQLSKNPPSKILFVGNLSFDTTEELLTQHFQHCGEIVRVRMTTFQDTGKCKGFAFIDFKDETGPTAALKDKSNKKLLNRVLRLEFGEDRSKRTPKRIVKSRSEGEGEASSEHKPLIRERTHTAAPQEQREYKPKPSQPRKPSSNSSYPKKRELSSVTLANAQRGSAAIVKSTGKKVTFD